MLKRKSPSASTTVTEPVQPSAAKKAKSSVAVATSSIKKLAPKKAATPAPKKTTVAASINAGDVSSEEDESDYSDLEEDDEETKSTKPTKQQQVELNQASSTLAAHIAKAKAGAGKSTATSTSTQPRGVVYIGHVPYGFFEESMRSFFTQFGDIRALKLSRSKKTARSKGYAFIEFEDLPTATIVAEAMNHYMMFGQTLKAHVVEQEKIHPDLFKGCDLDHVFRKMPNRGITRNTQNRVRTISQEKARLGRLTRKEEKKREQLKALGINYQFPGYKSEAVPEVPDTEAATPATAAPKTPKKSAPTPKKAAATDDSAMTDVEPAAPATSTKKKVTESAKKPAPATATKTPKKAAITAAVTVPSPTPVPAVTPKKVAATTQVAASTSKKPQTAAKSAVKPAASPAPSAKKTKLVK